MSGLARLLMQQNAGVSGSDMSKNQAVAELISGGARITEGHWVHNIDEGMTVVYSSDIPKDNVELLEAKRRGCRMLHRSELLQRLMASRKALAVAGTHGKTTSSALLSSALRQAGIDPSYMVGGIVSELGGNASSGEGDYFVAEADESDGSFLRYAPFGAIITNIDLDHLNHFGSEEALIGSFCRFAGQVASKEHLFWCGDDERLSQMNLPGVSYGFSEGCSLRLSNFRQEGWNCSFDVSYRETEYKNVEIALPGKHNALNGAAVFGLSLSVGAEEGAVRKALKHFGGVKRRSERIGEVSEILFLDDYAHHPTEIEATLGAVRKAVGERRVVAIYQPHRYSRLRYCLGNYGRCFQDADEVWVTDIYTAGEEPVEGVATEVIQNEIPNSRLVFRKDLECLALSSLRPHDVVVTLGAGDITHFGRGMLEAFEKEPPKKLTIGVVKGGASDEHEISLASSAYIEESLNQEIYDVKVFTIDRSGKWPEGVVSGELMQCDAVFPVLHGPFGEDGTIQGMFEMLGLPYVGCSHRAAAIAMDKSLTKKLAVLSGLRTLPYLSIHVRDWREFRGEVVEQAVRELSFPVFVKASHLGSSFGVIKVDQPDDLIEAVEEVFKLDSELIVEQGVKGREIEFAVLGNDELMVFPPGEILANGGVYDFEAKYSQASLPITTSPDLSTELVETGRRLAKKAFEAIGGEGMARIDFFLDEKDRYWLNEINPMPGLTEKSLYPKLCQKEGIDGKELVRRLIVLALHRRRRCGAVQHA